MDYIQNMLSDGVPVNSADFLAQVRPTIDAVLQRLNFSPRHIATKLLTDQCTTSVRFNISSQIFDSEDSASAGTKVVFRVTKRSGSFSVAVPANRLRFYAGCGQAQKPDSGWVRIDFTDGLDISKFAKAAAADVEDQLLHYPSTFSCCARYKECSEQGRCIAADQDFAAGCYYKRNLLAGKNFYKNAAEKSVPAEIKSRLVAPNREWHKFADESARKAYIKEIGLPDRPYIAYLSTHATVPMQVEIIGWETAYWAIISDGRNIGGVHTDFLCDAYLATVDRAFPSKYVVLDIETTGFSAQNDKIIEISAHKYADGELVDCFDTLINPCCPISKRITSLTGISDCDVVGKPQIYDLRDDFLTFVAGVPLVGHNIRTFDLPFIEAALDIDLGNPCIDTLHLARKAYPKRKSYKLVDLNADLELSSGVAHRAAADVEATNALFQRCIQQISAKTRVYICPPLECS